MNTSPITLICLILLQTVLFTGFDYPSNMLFKFENKLTVAWATSLPERPREFHIFISVMARPILKCSRPYLFIQF